MRDRVTPLTDGGGAQADERVVVDAQLGAGHEVLVAADPGDLPAVDVVRHHLAVEVDAQGAVDGDEGVVAGDDRRVVDHLRPARTPPRWLPSSQR